MELNDGEPYELPELNAKTNALKVLESENIETVINTQWDSGIYYISSNFPEALEQEFIKYFNARPNNSAEIRFKILSFLCFFIHSFSLKFVHTTAYKIFLEMCKDDYWAIKKKCSACINGMLELMPMCCHTELINYFKEFLNNKNLLVRQSAYNSLGKVLYSALNLDASLLEHAEELSQSDNPQAVELAYYLPGILRKYPDQAEKILSILKNLLNNIQSLVRAKATGTLGFFITNVPKSLYNELIPIYLNLLRDIDIIKIEAIKNLGVLLKSIDNQYKSQFLGSFKRIQLHNLNWRINKNIAKSIISVANGISIEIYMQELWKTALALCYEKAEVVRLKAGKGLGNIIKDVWGISFKWQDQIKKDVLSMLTQSYKTRIVLAYVTGKCIQIQFCEEIFQNLCCDVVSNVRIACALVVSKYSISKYKQLLLKDLDFEVRHLAGLEKVTKFKYDYLIVPIKDNNYLDGFDLVFSDQDERNDLCDYNLTGKIETIIRVNKGYITN